MAYHNLIGASLEVIMKHNSAKDHCRDSERNVNINLTVTLVTMSCISPKVKSGNIYILSPVVVSHTGQFNDVLRAIRKEGTHGQILNKCWKSSYGWILH